jgi:hypothetical protein
MNKIPVAEVSVGTVVAKPVYDVSGRMLVSAGTALTEKHLRAFKIWGIGKVCVDSGDLAEPETGVIPRNADPEALARAKAVADERFRFASVAHPAMAMLYDLGVARILASQSTQTDSCSK